MDDVNLPFSELVARASEDRGILEVFVAKAREHDARIQTLLKSADATGLVDGVASLSTTALTSSTRQSIAMVSEDANKSGSTLLRKRVQLAECRLLAKNANAAGDALAKCIAVLHTAMRVSEMAASKKRRFAALRLLETLLVQVQGMDYAFARLIRESARQWRQTVRNGVVSDCRTWLDDIRSATREIGAREMRKTSDAIVAWESDPNNSNIPFGSAVYRIIHETEEQQDELDLAPVYEAVHVHVEIGMFDEFKHDFDADRQAQRELVVPSGLTLVKLGNNDDERVERMNGIIEDVAGFAIIERILFSRVKGLRSQRQIDVTWDLLCSRVTEVLKPSSAEDYVMSPDMLVEFKASLIVLAHTIGTREYAMARLHAFLGTLATSYISILKHRFYTQFDEALNDDSFVPMVISTRNEFDEVMSVCVYEPSSDTVRLPITLPFSSIYPDGSKALSMLVDAFFNFAEKGGSLASNTKLLRKVRFKKYILLN